MSGSTDGAGGYQAIKEMIGMYALLICSLFSIFFKWTEFWLLPKMLLAVELLSWRSCTEKFPFAKTEKQYYQTNDLTWQAWLVKAKWPGSSAFNSKHYFQRQQTKPETNSILFYATRNRYLTTEISI